jgi:hypothetical protein
MLITDYIIDHQDFDWYNLLAYWAWILPEEFTIWLMNRYGDLFIVFEEGSIYMLDVGNGTLRKLAESRDDFCTKVSEDNNANNWLMIPLIDELRGLGKELLRGKCYSFVIPPALGGVYTVENTCVLSIAEHYGVYAVIHEQIKGLQEGTQVTLKTEASHSSVHESAK